MEVSHARKHQLGVAIMVVATIAWFAASLHYRAYRLWLVVGWAIAFTFGKVLKDFRSKAEIKDQKSN